MSLNVGTNSIGSIYIGSQNANYIAISEVYYGSTLVYSSGYPSGTVLFEKGTAGTYTLTVKKNCTVSLILVGGGGGGSYSNSYGSWTNTQNGGSGGMVTGNCSLTKGNYTIVVGAAGTGLYSVNGGGGAGGTAGSGGQSTAFGNTAGGGGGAYTWTGYFDSRGSAGGAGSASAISGCTASNGAAGSTSNRYGNYGGGGPGGGGSAANNNGKVGYCKVTVV